MFVKPYDTFSCDKSLEYFTTFYVVSVMITLQNTLKRCSATYLRLSKVAMVYQVVLFAVKSESGK